MDKVDTKKELSKYSEAQIEEAKKKVHKWWTNVETRSGYGYETALLFELKTEVEYSLQFTTKFNRYGEEFSKEPTPALMETLYDDIECWFDTEERAVKALDSFHFSGDDNPEKIELVRRELTILREVEFKEGK